MKFFIFYLLAINLVGIILVAYDKRAAKKHKWRTRESTFFLLSALGGSLGIYSFMRIFHHKTLHKRFMIGLPLIFLTQIAILVFILFKFKEAFNWLIF